MISSLTRAFTVDGVTLAWDRWGERPGATPLVLCHGFSGSSHDFALHIEPLAETHDVIVLDHRGHGRSENLGAVERYSLDRLAADLVGFLESEVGVPVDLLGHSMGGAVGLRATLGRPELVRSLILMDTSAWSFVPVDPDLAALTTAFLEGFEPGRGLPRLVSQPGPEDELIAAATPPEWRALKEQVGALFDPFAMKALGWELFAPETASVRGRLDEITCPVSIIVGEFDRPYVDQAPELAAALPDSELVVIRGAYHSPQLSHPDEWTAAVEAHRARLAG
jgi:pimeloyl-ACP methyl ester carboxylesterase